MVDATSETHDVLLWQVANGLEDAATNRVADLLGRGLGVDVACKRVSAAANSPR